ncbi:MAG: PASTA domain-containing protein [Marmoricola sp.]
MLTETEARELLQTAAGTIDVRAGQPIIAPPRTRWVAPVVAAAAVLVAVVVGFLVVRDDGGTSPARPVPTPIPVIPTPNGRIPSVFAYDATSAIELLKGLGLKVAGVSVDAACESPGRALRTEPPVGSRIVPGQAVTLFYSRPSQALGCPLGHPSDAIAWRILDYANGRGADPGFSDDAQFLLNGTPTDSAQALSALATLTREGGVLDPHQDPVLAMFTQNGARTCEERLPPGVTGPTSYAFRIGFVHADLAFRCPSAMVYLNRYGRIDGLSVIAEPALLQTVDEAADPDAVALAARLLKFANASGTRFPGNETVRLYSDGVFWNSLTGPEAEDRDNYSLCSGLGPPQCTPSYLDAMDLARGGYEVKPTLPTCFDPKRIVGPGRGNGSKTAYIMSPSTTACRAGWAIELRYDSPDKLYAVNTLSTR